MPVFVFVCHIPIMHSSIPLWTKGRGWQLERMASCLSHRSQSSFLELQQGLRATPLEESNVWRHLEGGALCKMRSTYTQLPFMVTFFLWLSRSENHVTLLLFLFFPSPKGGTSPGRMVPLVTPGTVWTVVFVLTWLCVSHFYSISICSTVPSLTATVVSGNRRLSLPSGDSLTASWLPNWPPLGSFTMIRS